MSYFATANSALFVAIAFTIHSPARGGGPESVGCSTPPEQAAVRLFEYIEDPNLQVGSPQAYEAIFSKRLLASSSTSAVDSAIKSARSTYQDNRTETPLSRRLAAPPALIPKEDKSFNARGDATVRILSLSARGKIEQRMAVSCEIGDWKVQSFSYGPQDLPVGTTRP